MRNFSVVVVFLLLASAVGIVWYASNEAMAADKTIRPSYMDITETMSFSGVAMPSKEFDVKSTISGVLEELYVKEGDYVVLGTPIAKVQLIKNPEEYSNIERQLITATSKKNLAKSNLERTTILREKELISVEEYEIAESDYNIALAEYNAVIAEINMLKGIYNGSERSNIIRATNSGTILELPLKEGGSVMARGSFSEGSTIARIADLTSLVFVANVDEVEMQRLRTGIKMAYSFAGGSNVSAWGKVINISPVGKIEHGVTVFEIRGSVELDGHGKSIVRAGSRMNAKIVLRQKRNVLALEEKYLQFSYDTVYVEIKDKNKYVRRNLKTGISDGTYIEILSGLKSTDEVRQVAITTKGNTGMP